MKVRDYEYNYTEEYEISEKRKNELIKKVKYQISKGFIAHYQILKIGKNDDELDYIYDWLDKNHVEIRGINGTISGEIPNFEHIPKMGKSNIPDVLDEKEKEELSKIKQKELYEAKLNELFEAKQKELFLELQKFSDEDKKNNTEEYQKVRNKIVEQNMKLAKWVANWSRFAKFNIPFEDRYQMAYIGLINAVEKFNPTLGFKFSTYATKAIYRRIEREIYRTDENLKMNIEFNENLEMLPEIENKIEVELGRKAKPKEIANILGITTNEVKELEIARKLQEKESLEQIEEDRNDPETIFSNLSDDEKLIETDDGYVKDGVYMDEEDTLPVGFRNNDRSANRLIAEDLREDLMNAMSILKEREKIVLLLRFGIDGSEPITLAKVGKKLNVNRERVRQIEAKALSKLKNRKRLKILGIYRESMYNGELEEK